jgi:hypothetical protein
LSVEKEEENYHGEKVDTSSNKGASTHPHFFQRRERENYELQCAYLLKWFYFCFLKQEMEIKKREEKEEERC